MTAELRADGPARRPRRWCSRCGHPIPAEYGAESLEEAFSEEAPMCPACDEESLEEAFASGEITWRRIFLN